MTDSEKVLLQSNSALRIIKTKAGQTASAENDVLEMVLPRSGYLYGGKSCFQYDLDLACDTNAAELARGVSNMSSVVVIICPSWLPGLH